MCPSLDRNLPTTYFSVQSSSVYVLLCYFLQLYTCLCTQNVNQYYRKRNIDILVYGTSQNDSSVSLVLLVYEKNQPPPIKVIYFAQGFKNWKMFSSCHINIFKVYLYLQYKMQRLYNMGRLWHQLLWEKSKKYSLIYIP